jgi:uncharacterized DUF497 family protein
VEFEWDDEKAASNLAKHGVSFELVYDLDWTNAVAEADDRRDYGELRLRTLIVTAAGERFMIVFTPRRGRHRIEASGVPMQGSMRDGKSGKAGDQECRAGVRDAG